MCLRLGGLILSNLFPQSPQDGQIFTNYQDVYYRYDGGLKSWIRIMGYGSKVDLATPLRDGLMSSEDFRKVNGLLIPPPQTSLTSDSCYIVFDSGTIGFRSSQGHLFINYELDLVTRDERGNPITEKRLFKIHENTYGIDFRVNLEKLVSLLEARGQLTYRKSVGPQGEKGDKGRAGVDRVETGPKGDKGDDGRNFPYPGSIIQEQADFITSQDNRGIVDIGLLPVSRDENYLVITRGNIGSPDFCPKFVEPDDISSKWILAVDERPLYKTVVRECEDKVCSVDNCQPDTINPPVAQAYCSSKLYYLDIAPIERKIKDRYLELLQELRETKEEVINSWLQTMIRVFNEQKQALCCALENCRSRRENARERARIEDDRVLAATADLGIAVDGVDQRKWVETDQGKDCATSDQPKVPQVISATDGTIFTAPGTEVSGYTEITKYSMSISCKDNVGSEKSVVLELPAGRYLVDYEACCCYAPSKILDVQPFRIGLTGVSTGLVSDIVRSSENEWSKIAPVFDTGDFSVYKSELWDAVKLNKPYSGSVSVIFSQNGKQTGVVLFPKESFRYNEQAREFYMPDSRRKLFGTAHDVYIEHGGGPVYGFFPGIYNDDPNMEPVRVPNVTKDIDNGGYSGEVGLIFTKQREVVPVSQEIPVEECEAGSVVDVDVSSVGNIVPFIPYPTLNVDDRTVVNPFNYTPVEGLSGVPVSISLKRGSYELEVKSCCYFSSFVIQDWNVFLVITKDMYDAAVNDDLVGFMDAWIKSKNNARVTTILGKYPLVIKGDTIDSGCINDFAVSRVYKGFLEPSIWIKHVSAFKPYRGVITVVYPSIVDPNRPVFYYVAQKTIVYTADERVTPGLFGTPGQSYFPGSLEDEVIYLDNNFVALDSIYTVQTGIPEEQRTGLVMKGRKGYQRSDDASGTYLGVKLQVDTIGGGVAVFVDDAQVVRWHEREIVEEGGIKKWVDRVRYIPEEFANEGSMRVGFRCLEQAAIDCSKTQIEVDLDCSVNNHYVENFDQVSPQKAVAFELGAGSYIAEVVDCCCRFGLTTKGKFFLKYQRWKNLPAGTLISPVETISNADFGEFSSDSETFANYVGTTIAFEHAGGEVALWVDTNVKNVSGAYNPTGRIKVKLQHKECYDFLGKAPVVGTGTGSGGVGDIWSSMNDFRCDLPLSMIDQYEYQWKQNNICGFIGESGGSLWIVMVRSLGNDISCGGGESILAPCIEGCRSQFGSHPAIAFPTFNGMDFAGKPLTMQRMAVDGELCGVLLAELTDMRFVVVKKPGKIIYGPGRWPFQNDPPPGISGVSVSDIDKLDIRLNVIPKFGVVLFPTMLA